MKAVLTINVKLGYEEAVHRKLMMFPAILNASRTIGAFDIIAIVHLNDVAAYRKMLIKKIPEIEVIEAAVPIIKKMDEKMQNKLINYL